MMFGVAYSSALSEILLKNIGMHYGSSAEQRVREWQALVNDYADKTDLEKLKAVNDFFNHARFINDINLWNQTDYWATPLEFMIKDAGDCEDFSIAKYFTLAEMGMDISRLRITYVAATRINVAHMVLAYYSSPGAEPIILDNINPQLKTASERQDLEPVYSFNAEDLWLARSRNSQLKAGNSSQISLWRDLNERMQLELL